MKEKPTSRTQARPKHMHAYMLIRAIAQEGARLCSARASSTWLPRENSPRDQDMRHGRARNTKTMLTGKYTHARPGMLQEIKTEKTTAWAWACPSRAQPETTRTGQSPLNFTWKTTNKRENHWIENCRRNTTSKMEYTKNELRSYKSFKNTEERQN